jgi:hypothetical protein
MISRIRAAVRTQFFKSLRHVASIDDTRDILAEVMAQQNASFGNRSAPELEHFESPYVDSAQVVTLDSARTRAEPIFITARFRTGSTLLWNLFRNIPGITSYYEPFNERRWFDQQQRGNGVDATHLGVAEYWSEYRNLPELAAYYSEEWTRRHLCMTRSSWNPAMQRYIELMIEKAPGRPVLQFNRVDLRLPWLRARFPQARILHLYRNPRDQWCSTLPELPGSMHELRIGTFNPFDGYYLLSWARDLKHSFPFLTLDADAHPYELFYQLWKLSFAYGRTWAHASVSFESLIDNPEAVIQGLASEFSLTGADPKALAALVVEGKCGRWQSKADEIWFRTIERRVDDDFRRHFGREVLSESRNIAPSAMSLNSSTAA